MNQISDPALEYGAGQDFNYAVWTADTRLTLVNVPWDNSYRDIVGFDNRAALNAYIDNRQTTHSQIKVRYARVSQPIDINIPFNQAYRYNYIRARQGAQPIPGDTSRDFYYFILDVQHVAPNTTRLIVQLDVWQTFGYDVVFGRAFIERGHIGVANENKSQNYGRDYLTVPEGLNLGGEYRTVARSSKAVMHSGRTSHGNPADNERPCVLVLSSVQLFGQSGTVDAPVMKVSVPQAYGASSFGLGAYIFETQNDYEKFARAMVDKPWIMQGIQSVTLIPSIKRYHPNFEFGSVTLDGREISVQVFDYGDSITPGGWIGAGTANPDMAYPNLLTHKMAPSWRESDNWDARIPARYQHVKAKLFTFPYMAIEVTTWNGNVLIVKPESWNDPDATIRERGNIMPPTQRVTFMVYRYNAGEEFTDAPNGDDTGEFLDMAINIDSFPTIPVINNQGIMYLAQNARGLNWQNQSAEWSQQRALAGADTSYDQASMGIQTASAQTAQGNRYSRSVTDRTNSYNQQTAIVDAIAGIAQGAAGGAAAGGGRGALGGATAGALSAPLTIINAMRAADHSTALNTMAQGQNTATTDISNRNAAYARDTNMALANYAAKGDYANTIAGINARVQDAQLSQPSIVGQIGGDLIDVNYGTSEIALRWKMLDPSAMALVCEYWLRFGYAVNRFAQMPASLMVMSKFTYWKLAETYLTSAPMPEMFKQAIRGIFEKGVTVWKNPDDIGVIDTANNEPLNGITL